MANKQDILGKGAAAVVGGVMLLNLLPVAQAQAQSQQPKGTMEPIVNVSAIYTDPSICNSYAGNSDLEKQLKAACLKRVGNGYTDTFFSVEDDNLANAQVYVVDEYGLPKLVVLNESYAEGSELFGTLAGSATLPKGQPGGLIVSVTDRDGNGRIGRVKVNADGSYSLVDPQETPNQFAIRLASEGGVVNPQMSDTFFLNGSPSTLDDLVAAGPSAYRATVEKESWPAQQTVYADKLDAFGEDEQAFGVKVLGNVPAGASISTSLNGQALTVDASAKKYMGMWNRANCKANSRPFCDLLNPIGAGGPYGSFYDTFGYQGNLSLDNIVGISVPAKSMGAGQQMPVSVQITGNGLTASAYAMLVGK